MLKTNCFLLWFLANWIACNMNDIFFIARIVFSSWLVCIFLIADCFNLQTYSIVELIQLIVRVYIVI